MLIIGERLQIEGGMEFIKRFLVSKTFIKF